MRTLGTLCALLWILVPAGPLRADERDDVRSDIRVEEARTGRLESEIATLDRKLGALRIEHEAAGHPRIVLERHRASAADLDRRVAEAEAARYDTECRAGWHDGGVFGTLASVALWLGLSEEHRWYADDLERTLQELEAARAARNAADDAFVQRIQNGIRVAPVRPSDWAEYPLGRPNDVFAPSLDALERMAEEGDLRQAGLSQRIALLTALRKERESGLREAEERLRLLRSRERGLDVPATPPTPPETDVDVARYRGGLSPRLQAAIQAAWTEACRRNDMVPIEGSTKGSEVVLEIRRTPEGVRATVSKATLTMDIASRGRLTGNGHFTVAFTFEEGRAGTDGVFRGEVTSVSSAQGSDMGRPFQWSRRTSTTTWVARPEAPPGRGYGIHFGDDSVPAFELKPMER